MASGVSHAVKVNIRRPTTAPTQPMKPGMSSISLPMSRDNLRTSSLSSVLRASSTVMLIAPGSASFPAR